MLVTEPTPEEVASIQSTHPFRFPTLIHITVPGDRGAAVRLPFVMGNPTGACAMPLGKEPTTVWNSFVTAALSQEALPEGEEAASLDCILWPAPDVVSQWFERWPALPAQTWKAAKKKCGALLEAGADPDPADAKLPSAVKAALDKNPRAALRRYNPRKESFLFLVDPPASSAWRIFMGSIREGKEVAKTAGEMAQVCTRFVFDEQRGMEVPFAEVTKQWPGLAVQACLTVSVMAGAATQIELGE